jgi:hypothetical protein
MMGWGLLDKRILLLTEDSKTHLLRAILSQWPEIERSVALWPLHGSGKLLDASGCASLQALLGGSMKIVVHRDRDFMMPTEADVFCKDYNEKDIRVWLTRWADIEAYWCDTKVIAKHFDIDTQTAQTWLNNAVEDSQKNDDDRKCRNRKREDLRNKPPLNKIKEKGDLAAFDDESVVNEYCKAGHQYSILGKTLVSKIRAAAQDAKNPSAPSFGDKLPEGLDAWVADDLKELLESLLK